MSKNVILFVFGVFALCNTVLALECYVCSDCPVPYEVTDDTPTTDCGDGSCTKVNVTLKTTVIVSRGCTPKKVEQDKCVRYEESGSITESCFCNDEQCNSATQTMVTSSLYVVCSVLTFMTIAMFAHA